MRTEGTNTPIPTEVLELIEFFDQQLGDVQFPDVDRSRLAELASRVRDRSTELDRLTEQARAVRAELDEAREELQRAATRGLAYARVYAEGDEALSEAVGQLTLGQEQKPEKSRRRARSGGQGQSKGQSKGKGKASRSGASARAGGDDSTEQKPTLPFTSNDLTEAA